MSVSISGTPRRLIQQNIKEASISQEFSSSCILSLYNSHLPYAYFHPSFIPSLSSDLLLPQVGGSARKTNYDYTGGQLPQLIDIIIESGAKLFVSAVGVPPKEVVEKLHKAKIPIANMIVSGKGRRRKSYAR